MNITQWHYPKRPEMNQNEFDNAKKLLTYYYNLNYCFFLRYQLQPSLYFIENLIKVNKTINNTNK